MEGLEKEDLRQLHGCNMFRACIENCMECLRRNLTIDAETRKEQHFDIDNDILYNSDKGDYDPDDGEFNFV